MGIIWGKKVIGNFELKVDVQMGAILEILLTIDVLVSSNSWFQ